MPTPRRRPPTAPSSRRAGRRLDAGSAVLELVAATGLAGLLISVAVATLTGVTPLRLVQGGVCPVLVSLEVSLDGCGSAPGGGDGPGADEPGGQGGSGPVEHSSDAKPEKCKKKEHEEATHEEVSLGFISLGHDRALIRSEFSDGSVEFTVTDGAEIKAAGGFGGHLDIGKLQAGASVDFGAGLKLGYGSTWTAKNAAEADELESKVKRWITWSELAPATPHQTFRPFPPPAPPPPTQTVRSLEVEADASGSVGLSLPWGSSDGSGGSKAVASNGNGNGNGGGGGKGDGDGSGSADLGSVGVEFGASHKWTQITNTEDGSVTYTTEGQLSADATASSGAGSAGVKTLLGSSLSITRDHDGQITGVEMTTTKPGKVTVGDSDQPDSDGDATAPSSDGDVTVTTTHLDVTDADRPVVERWLAAQGTGGAVSADTYYPKRRVPGAEFQNLVYDQATVSNVVYKVDKDQETFAAEVKVGVAFGVEFSSSTTDTYAVDASYLGWGDGSNERQPVDYPECIAT